MVKAISPAINFHSLVSVKRSKIRYMPLYMDSTDSELLDTRNNILLKFSLFKIWPCA